MNLLRPAMFNLALVQAFNPLSKCQFQNQGYSGLRSAVRAIAHPTATTQPQAIPATPKLPEHLEVAVGEMCRLLVPSALASQARNPEQLATLGEYFADILGSDPSKIEAFLAPPAVLKNTDASIKGPVATASQLVRGLIHSANMQGVQKAPLSELISKIDSTSIHLLKSLFTECLTLQKRGLSTELKPLLTALENEEARRI